jgi:hypothetical protein
MVWDGFFFECVWWQITTLRVVVVVGVVVVVVVVGVVVVVVGVVIVVVGVVVDVVIVVVAVVPVVTVVTVVAVVPVVAVVAVVPVVPVVAAATSRPRGDCVTICASPTPAAAANTRPTNAAATERRAKLNRLRIEIPFVSWRDVPTP